MIRIISRRLCTSLNSPEEDRSGKSIPSDPHMNSDQSEDSDYSDSDVPFEYGDEDDFGLVAQETHPAATANTHVYKATLARIRQDLRVVRDTGFRVGKICGVDEVSEHNILTISVKVSEVEFSRETRLVWNLESSSYIVLLIKYTGLYASFDEILQRPIEESKARLEFRLRKCSRYRPTIGQAIAAFSATSSERQTEKEVKITRNVQKSPSGEPEFSSFEVGDSIERLLNNDFLVLTKLRKSK